MNSRAVYIGLIIVQIFLASLGAILAFLGQVNIAVLSIATSVALIAVTGHLRMRRVFTALVRVSSQENSAVTAKITSRLHDAEKRIADLVGGLTVKEQTRLQNIDIPADIGRTANSRFDPLAVPSTEIESKPSAQFAGRLAADQVMAEDSAMKLHSIFAGGAERSARNIVVLGTGALIDALTYLGNVQPIFPGQIQSSVPAETAYFIIDEVAFEGGPWGDTDSTQKSGVMLQLIDSIKAAKKNGTVIFFIGRDRSSHYSATLRELSDVIIKDGQSDLQWEDDIYMPVLNKLIELTNLKEI